MNVLDLLSGNGANFGSRSASAAGPPTSAAGGLGSGANVEAAAAAAAATAAAPATTPPDLSLLTVDPAIIGGTSGGGSGGSGATRVLLCGTYPIGQSNGYSRVVYYTARYLGEFPDIALTIYGFQNYNQTADAGTRRDIPASVRLHDALASENPRRNGFGENEIAAFLRANPQDVVIIFNDMVITAALVKNIVAELTPAERARFKLVSYMDQVYPYQKPEYIEMLNTQFDAIIAFTPYWREVARQVGIRADMPIYFYPHGFDPKLYYPLSRKLARRFYTLPQPNEAFLVLNLNRNQPRKRLDHTMMVWADVVARHLALKRERSEKNPPRMIQLVVGTQMQGFWDLQEIFRHELRLRGIDPDTCKDYVVSMSRPQQMSDRDINILYNACDIGLNTCEGEGFGLCQFEHGAIGCPQVAPRLGGFREFLNEGNSILVEPRIRYYVDKNRDQIGGIAELGDPREYADAIWKYYMNPGLVAKHGAAARRDILTNYRWPDMVALAREAIRDIIGANDRTASDAEVGEV